MAQNGIITVTELTRRIKGVLEHGFTELLVQGEISNAKLHSSGHFYFSLKDESAQLNAVMWRSRVQNLPFRPADGMKVIARGNITLYEPRGSYQLDCLSLQPLGVGELQRAYEQLRNRLMAEGLFESSRKKPLPEHPSVIAVITSPTGAAVKDMLSVLRRRMPSLEIVLVPVRVQGAGAADEIAGALDLVNEWGGADLIITGRGGGSMEDLWAFNEEVVARAVARSRVPVISAVGHEVDFTICDFVADLRAPTPSAAAELAVKEASDLIELIGNYCYTMHSSVMNSIAVRRKTVEHLVRSYSFHRPIDLLRQRSQTVDELSRRLEHSSRQWFQSAALRLREYTGRIQSLDPALVLKRGYAIVRQEGRVVSAAHNASVPGEAVITFHDGALSATVHDRTTEDHGKERD